ncbi:hypothetical protein [Streptomyces europaeiscabiei]|uniref:hypothetical protein n=1 Tax=Streptomyces europaeiscabiei TaxID=146819 RepID=UPI000765E021|nr:hypothetical protein [Streptomyces europaeiscabiei]
MKKDYLKWGALLFALVATASAEYELARAVGFNQWVAAAVPGALDIYTVRAMRARKDVLAAVAAMIGVNAASHLVTAGLVAVSVPLVVAVSAIAPLVLWRVHRLADEHDVPDEPEILDVIQDSSPAPEYAEAEPVPAVPEVYPQRPEVVPAGVQLLPIVARPVAVEKALVLASEAPRTRPEVHAEYVPEPVPDWTVDGTYADEDSNPAQADPLDAMGLGWAAEQFKDELLAGEMPSIRAIKDRLRVGQNRAKEIQDGFRQAQAAWRLAGSGARS